MAVLTADQKAFIINKTKEGLKRNEINAELEKVYGFEVDVNYISKLCKKEGVESIHYRNRKIFTKEMEEYIKENYKGSSSIQKITDALNRIYNKNFTASQLSSKVSNMYLTPATSEQKIIADRNLVDYKKLRMNILEIKEKAAIGKKIALYRFMTRAGRDTKIISTGIIKGIYTHYMNIEIKGHVNSYKYSDLIRIIE